MERVGRTIPLDLVIEILSWLPARSLLRFRHVCKLWLSITTDPRFIDTNLDRSRKSRRPPSVLLFLSHDEGDHCGIAVIDDDPKRVPDRFLIVPRSSHHHRRRRQRLHMSSPCNGLVCISDGNVCIELLNPTTGERHTPPPHYWRANIGFQHIPCLGFHPETKEYKVVRFCWYNFGKEWGWDCEVYTLGTNSWKQIQYPNNCLSHNSAVNVNGALYWRINPHGGFENDDALLSFDLKEERFTLISVPDFVRVYKQKVYLIGSVVELQGSVCLLVCCQQPKRTDVWMMVLSSDCDGSTHEWALKHSISCFMDTPLFIHNERILVGHGNWNHRVIGDKNEPSTLEYHHLECKGGCTREVYGEGKPEGPFIYHYLKGQDGSNYEEFYRNAGMRYSTPFAHVESLVSLPNQ